MSTQSSGCHRNNTRQYSAEDQVLNVISKEVSSLSDCTFGKRGVVMAYIILTGQRESTNVSDVRHVVIVTGYEFF